MMNTIQRITVEILRDMWVGPVEGPQGKSENRLRAGKRMEVDLSDQVLSGIESGALRRVKEEELAAEAAKAAKAKARG